VKCLVENGADINYIKNKKNKNSLSPLSASIIFNHDKITQYLIKIGVNINIYVNEYQETPLKIVMRFYGYDKSYYETFKMLIQYGANDNITTLYFFTINFKHDDEEDFYNKKVELIKEVYMKNPSDFNLSFIKDVIPDLYILLTRKNKLINILKNISNKNKL
jgi:ankyrin repeat protein